MKFQVVKKVLEGNFDLRKYTDKNDYYIWVKEYASDLTSIMDQIMVDMGYEYKEPMKLKITIERVN